MNFEMKSITLTVATALLSLGTAGFAAEPIKIGVSGPFTGGSAPMGVSMRDGVKLAVSEINAKGGVLGRQLQLIERDEEAKNERGVQVAQELINKENVVATVGYINTGVALASQRFYEEAKIPVINNVATGSVITKQFLPPEHKDNYIFRTSANDTIQSAMIGSWTLSMGNFIDNAGKNGDGALMPQTFIQDGNTPKRKAFIEAYQKAYKVDRMPSPVSAAQGYDSIYLLAAAIKQAGSTEG